MNAEGAMQGRPAPKSLQGCCHLVGAGRLQWSEPSQREERDISYPLFGESIDEGVVTSARQVIKFWTQTIWVILCASAS